MPELIIGSPPRGNDYYGQETLIETLWRKLENDNVLLSAPRRFGKTGAMYRLLDEPKADFRPIYMDVEHIENAADFMIELIANLLRDKQLSKLLDGLWEKTQSFARFIGNLPAHVDIGGVKVELREQTDVPKQWLSYGERVMNLISASGDPVLLLIDEFAVMINTIASKNPKEVKQLLRWFRSARISPGSNTRFVIGGSVNLINTLDALGLVDTVNDLVPVRLHPFPHETAKLYLQGVFDSRNIVISNEIINLILELTGEPIPYLLAVLVSSIIDRHKGKRIPITLDLVRDAFEMDLLGDSASAFFRQYRSRIDQYYRTQEAIAAKAILRALSKAEKGISANSLFNIYIKAVSGSNHLMAEDAFMLLMDKLDNDFYIVIRDNNYEFFSRVIKLWWRNHYGFQAEE